jgi:hypothetical protein
MSFGLEPPPLGDCAVKRLGLIGWISQFGRLTSDTQDRLGIRDDHQINRIVWVSRIISHICSPVDIQKV